MWEESISNHLGKHFQMSSHPPPRAHALMRTPALSHDCIRCLMGEEGQESLKRPPVTMKDNSSVLSGYRILFRTMKVKLLSLNFVTENIIWKNYKENKNHLSRSPKSPTLPSGMPCTAAFPQPEKPSQVYEEEMSYRPRPESPGYGGSALLTALPHQ